MTAPGYWGAIRSSDVREPGSGSPDDSDRTLG